MRNGDVFFDLFMVFFKYYTFLFQEDHKYVEIYLHFPSFLVTFIPYKNNTYTVDPWDTTIIRSEVGIVS